MLKLTKVQKTYLAFSKEVFSFLPSSKHTDYRTKCFWLFFPVLVGYQERSPYSYHILRIEDLAWQNWFVLGLHFIFSSNSDI